MSQFVPSSRIHLNSPNEDLLEKGKYCSHRVVKTDRGLDK